LLHCSWFGSHGAPHGSRAILHHIVRGWRKCNPCLSLERHKA
jgi:hypothetical protein